MGSDGTRLEEWPSAGAGGTVATAPKPEPAPLRAVAAAGFLLDAVRRRRSGRMALWGLVVALSIAGVSLLAYPVFTNFYADRVQSRLEKEFAALEATQPTGFSQQPVAGKALTRIVIPRLKVNVIVVEGTSGNALRAGAGHYPRTALPGSPTGNVAIAGHRTGFGQPFRHLERLREGDDIILQTPIGRYTYKVTAPFDGHANPWVTQPDDLTVLSDTPFPSLTLTTCDPPGTSRLRLIVRAQLSDSSR